MQIDSELRNSILNSVIVLPSTFGIGSMGYKHKTLYLDENAIEHKIRCQCQPSKDVPVIVCNPEHSSRGTHSGNNTLDLKCKILFRAIAYQFSQLGKRVSELDLDFTTCYVWMEPKIKAAFLKAYEFGPRVSVPYTNQTKEWKLNELLPMQKRDRCKIEIHLRRANTSLVYHMQAGHTLLHGLKDILHQIEEEPSFDSFKDLIQGAMKGASIEIGVHCSGIPGTFDQTLGSDEDDLDELLQPVHCVQEALQQNENLTRIVLSYLPYFHTELFNSPVKSDLSLRLFFNCFKPTFFVEEEGYWLRSANYHHYPLSSSTHAIVTTPNHLLTVRDAVFQGLESSSPKTNDLLFLKELGLDPKTLPYDPWSIPVVHGVFHYSQLLTRRLFLKDYQSSIDLLFQAYEETIKEPEGRCAQKHLALYEKGESIDKKPYVFQPKGEKQEVQRFLNYVAVMPNGLRENIMIDEANLQLENTTFFSSVFSFLFFAQQKKAIVSGNVNPIWRALEEKDDCEKCRKALAFCWYKTLTEFKITIIWPATVCEHAELTWSQFVRSFGEKYPIFDLLLWKTVVQTLHSRLLPSHKLIHPIQTVGLKLGALSTICCRVLDWELMESAFRSFISQLPMSERYFLRLEPQLESILSVLEQYVQCDTHAIPKSVALDLRADLFVTQPLSCFH